MVVSGTAVFTCLLVARLLMKAALEDGCDADEGALGIRKEVQMGPLARITVSDQVWCLSFFLHSFLYLLGVCFGSVNYISANECLTNVMISESTK